MPPRLVVDGEVADATALRAPSPDEAWALLAQRRQALDEVFVPLVPWLNKSFGCQHDDRFWDLSIGYFLRDLIATVQRLRAQLEAIGTICREVSISAAEPPAGGPQPPTDSRQAWLNHISEPWTTSVIVKRLMQGGAVAAMSLDASEEARRHLVSLSAADVTDDGSLRERATRRVLWAGQRRAANRLLLFQSGWETRPWLVIAALAPKQVRPAVGYRPEIEDVAVDIELRSRMPSPDAQESLATDVLRCMPDLLPISLLEGHRPFEAAAVGLFKTATPGVIVGPPGDDFHRHWSAQASERGTRIIFRQHGGVYGETIPTAREEYERYAGDGFITWGWDESGTYPLPAGNLVKRRRQYAGAWQGDAPRPVLWVTQELHFGPNDPPYESTTSYQARQRRLLEGLIEKGLAERLLLRLRPTMAAEDATDGYEWLDSYPVAVDRASDKIMDLTRRSCLVLVDRPYSTTFLECLANDHPTIVYAPGTSDYSRPSVRGLYEQLEEVGVLQTGSPEEVAANIAAVVVDPPGWWADPKRKAAVGSAREALARSGPRPLRTWARALQQLADAT